MDDVDGEVGLKMRSAIKAKLTELGCYVDDELPDYVMVMVANKRTRSQMEDDLQLFLGDNTELFVNWLHQVLKKLQEVSAAPAKSSEVEKKMERLKEKKSKDKKEKSKKSDSSKKSKKKAKEKAHKKKEEKKKSKKKRKHEIIRPNIPPLLMNMEKESEPSITDVFAGQILKNHGVIIETHKDEPKVVEKKPDIIETKRPIVPIIDPAAILSEIEALTAASIPEATVTVEPEQGNDDILISETSVDDKPNNEENKNETETKADEPAEKPITEQVERADSTDDEDFLNIRTEADELINDFGDDVVFKEISQPTLIETPPLRSRKIRSPSPLPPIAKRKDILKDIPETLPQIELNLPKRPVRERLGAPTQKKDASEEKDKEKRGKTTEKTAKSPERNTPEMEPELRPPAKSAKSRLGGQERSESQRKVSTSDDSEKSESSCKRLTSRVSVLDNRPPRVTCASVVRVRPRPRVGAPASSLLLRAVADAHKSLLNIPPKVEPEPQKVKRALVLPMRRNVDPKKIVIQVPCTETNMTDSISDNISLGELDSEEDDKNSKTASDVTSKDEYTPFSLTKVIQNTEYTPSRTLIRKDDTLLVETINIHNTTVDKDKGTQFIVTMDGYHPNAFLAKKLQTEGLLNDDEEMVDKSRETNKTDKTKKGLFRNIDTEGTKDKEKVLSETKTVPPISSIDSKEPTEKQKESKDEAKRSTPEKRKDDDSVDKSIIEKRKTDINIEEPILKRRKSDISADCSPEKRKRDTSADRPILKKQKSDSIIDRPILEKRKNDNIEKAIIEPQTSSFSNKSSPEKRTDNITPNKPVLEKQCSDVSIESSQSENDEKSSPSSKRRKASPIVFDVHKKEKEKEVERVRERTVSASSDSHVILTTAPSHKYDAIPPLSQASKPVVWCRAFPHCRYGSACAFAHPKCKFAAACTRRGCPYSHAHAAPLAAPAVVPGGPVVASHVVPAANYKTISAGSFANLCKFYPNCSNPVCHYYHPKPCRYGKACTNKLECNFYHLDVPGGKWKYSV